MESKKGLFSHFGGIIRIVILIILIALIAFFVVRFVRNRNDTKTAQTVSQTDKNKQSSSENNQENTESKESNSEESSGPATNPIPSGIAESDVVPSAGPENIPATGLTQDILLTALFLGMITFVYSKYSSKRRQLVQLRQS